MLLPKDEIAVSPAGWQLHDYLITHLELCWLGAPRLDTPCYAQVIIGSTSYPDAFLRVGTSTFDLSDIPNHSMFFEAWQKLVSEGRYEQSYLHFLLICIRSYADLGVTFVISDDRLAKVEVTLGKLKLWARLPLDTNILSSHFNGETALSED